VPDSERNKKKNKKRNNKSRRQEDIVSSLIDNEVAEILHRHTMLEPIRKQAMKDMASDESPSQRKAIAVGYTILASYGFDGNYLKSNWRRYCAGFH
jgi:hypothetical protein